jgi:hypothetical protein
VRRLQGRKVGEKRLGIFKSTGIEALSAKQVQEEHAIQRSGPAVASPLIAARARQLRSQGSTGHSPIAHNVCYALPWEENRCERGDGNRRFPHRRRPITGEKQCSIPGFFERAGPFALREIAEKVGATLARKEDGYRRSKTFRPCVALGLAIFLFSTIANTPVSLQTRRPEPAFCLEPMRTARPASLRP